MATRCNILFEDAEKIVQMYRHFDGYPSCILVDLHGAFQTETPKSAMNAAEIILREWKYDDGKDVAELEGLVKDYSEDLHGDIEWLYVVKAWGDEPGVTVYDMGYGHNGELGDKKPVAIIPFYYISFLIKQET
jgi:hypothetical protein